MNTTFYLIGIHISLKNTTKQLTLSIFRTTRYFEMERTSSTRVVAKKDGAITDKDKNAPNNESTEEVVINTPGGQSRRIVSKELFKGTAKDEESKKGNVKERSISSSPQKGEAVKRNKGKNVDASPKRSKRNVSENENKLSTSRKRKTRVKNSQLNASSASEDSADEDEMGESSDKKERLRVGLRSAKQLESSGNAADDKKSRLRDRSEQKSEEKENHSSHSEADSSSEQDSNLTDSSEDEEEEETPTISLERKRKEYPCFACEEIFRKTQDLFDHTCKGKQEKGFVCKFCKKVYNRRSTYLNHRFIHSRAKPYKCGMCGKRSVSQSNHIGHMKREHPEVLPFLCDPCDRSFISRRELVSHNKMVHNANQCRYCEEKFSTNVKMLRHRYKEHERYFKKKK